MKFIAPIIILCMVACSKDSVKEPIAQGASVAIASALECKNQPAIKEDLLAALSKSAKDVHALDKGVGQAACVAMVSVALPLVIGAGMNQIPAKWECSGQAAGTTITELAKKACALVSF